MKDVMGIINLQEESKFIRELTEGRNVESIPCAGRYRLIDFALSSMVNSGISNVGIMLPNNPRSVPDHLRSGKDWDLARRHEGLFYLPSAEDEDNPVKGDLKNFYHNLDFFEHHGQQYVLLANGSFIYNMDFNELLRFHQNTGADVTLVYHMVSGEQQGRSVVIETAENGLVEDLAIRNTVYDGTKVSMGIVLMSKRLFTEIIRDSYEHGGLSFELDALVRKAKDYTIYAYEHDGYTSHVDSTSSYYQTSMDVLQPEVWEELFMGENSIYTKVKDAVPVQYKGTSEVNNSLLANGCVVRGKVNNSILFRGVKVGEGATIKNSMIMEKCDIQDGAHIENVICDKNVIITKEKWLKGAPNYPLIVKKNVVI